MTAGGAGGAPAAVRALLAGAIDYAGLFPPAQLTMGEAVAAYAEHRADPAAWALGRFIVPVARLDELAEERRHRQHLTALPLQTWSLGALVGPQMRDELAQVAAFNVRDAHGRGGASIDALELRAGAPEQVHEALSLVPGTFERYVEIPLDAEPEPLLRAIREHGGMAKARTGGITADAFPAPEQLARFVAACVRLGVPFKATAGLHHPLRAEYRLTYEPDSAHGTMFGYLNLFLAAAFLRDGMSTDEAVTLLEERDPSAFAADETGIAWRGRRLSRDALDAARRLAIRGFGSCSFREPVDELALLPLCR